MRGFFARGWGSARCHWAPWLAGILMLVLGASGLGAESPAAGNLKQALWNQAGNLRVPFVENRGQIPDPQVRFYARTFGGTVYILQSGDVVYALPKRGPDSKIENSTGLAVLKESFGAGRRPAPLGDRPASTVVNSFLGADPARWQSNLPTFEQVNLGEVFAGVQLTLRAHGNNVEKIFTVAPGGDPLQIRVSLEGAGELAVNERGELEAATALGIVRFSAPVAWQTDAAGREVPVAIAYAADDDAFGFAIGAYDPGRPLMIDPLLASTFVGGSGDDRVMAVAVESSTSNIIVAGYTDSPNFPTRSPYQSALNGGYDIFISKFDRCMTNLIVSTYLGGSNNDVAVAMAMDGNSNFYVAGYTLSSDFPPIGSGYTNRYNGNQDGFVVKFSSNLTPSVSTLLGGSGTDTVNALAVDLNTNVFAVGYTESSDFPMAGSGYTNTYQLNGDGFLARFTNGLSVLLSSTFLGGNAQDAIQGIALSRATNVFVVGYTYSTNFPCTPTNSSFTNAYCSTNQGLCDAFVSRFSANLTNLDASTYLGGTNQDGAYAIGLDPRTNVYVAGYTYSTNFPVATNGAQTNLAGGCDAFIVSLFPALTNRIAGTYLGGTSHEQVNGMAIGYAISPGPPAGVTNIVVIGTTSSTNFPVTTNATYVAAGVGDDAFMAVFTTPLTNRYAVTYLGGAGNDRGLAVAVIGSNYVVAAGYTASSNFPISDATYSTRYNEGAYDGFVARLVSTLTYGTKKWEFVTLDDIYSSPCMGPDGTLYFGSGSIDGKFYAISSEGVSNWAYPITFSLSPYASPVVTTNGVVYSGSDNAAGDTFFALNATNGGLLYSTNFHKSSVCPALDENGYLYIGSHNSNHFNRLTANLTVDYTFISAQIIYSSPALGTNNNVYVGSPLRFYGFNRATGASTIIATNADGNFYSPAIGSTGTIYVGNASSNLMAFTPNGITSHVWALTGVPAGSPVIGTNGVIYVGTLNNLCLALYPDGTTQRVWNVGGLVENAPAIGDDGTVYVGAGSYLYSLNPVTGSTNWSFNLSDSCRASSPLIGMDGTIYIGSKDNKLYAIYGPTPPELDAPWPKFHHDMMNSGRFGFDHRPSPPAVVTASRGPYTNAVMVGWSAVPYATAYEIYRSTNSPFSTAAKIVSTSRTNYLDNINITPGILYYYWVRVKAPLGNSGFRGSDAGCTRPLPPTGISATKGKEGYTNTIKIAWSNSIGATGYIVYRADTPSTNSAYSINNTIVTNCMDLTMTRGLKYYYWVQATNSAGSSDWSTNDYGGTTPLPPGGLTASDGTSTEYVQVTWQATTGALSYVLYTNTATDSASASEVTNTTLFEFIHYGLTPCRHYYYWLQATNEFGLSGFSESDWGWRVLAPPVSVSASDGNYTTKIGVSWVVGNTNTLETTAHLVYRSLTNDANTAVVRIEMAYSAVTMTNYDDIEIIRGPVYYYWVRAKNAYGTSAWSQAESGGTVPLQPNGVIASDGEFADKVLISWTQSSYADTYVIYRSVDNNSSNAAVIGNVGGNITGYDDTIAPPGVIYYYWVRAVSTYGPSVFSGSDFGWRGITPPLAVAAGDGDSTNYVAITWSASFGATSYEVWRSADTNSAGAMKLVNSVATNSYQDTAAIAGVVYYYWVKAKTESITSSFSSPDSGYRAVGKVDIGASDYVLLPTVMAAGGHPDAVSFRIENYGDAVMTAPNYWVMSDFYLSANAVFGDSDDVLIGACSNSVPLNVLTSAGITLTGTTRQLLTIPDLSLGRYYAFVHIWHCLPSAWNDPVPANNYALRLGQTITISNTASTTTVLNDYNGDGRADLAVYHESDGRWYIRTVEGTRILYGDSWGEPGYQPVVGDYDDNGSSDLAVYHEASGYWFIRSVAGAIIAWRQWWGSPGYQPVPGDYNGDRKSDLAVYHEADGYWYISSLAGETIAWAEWWGAPGYQAVPGDYDADGKCDFAVYHEADGFWYIRTVSGSMIAWATWWGGEGYQAVPGDYDGDGASDLAVYSTPTGYWFIQSVSGKRIAWGEYWGMPDYTPVPGDYDGDGIYDLAVYNEAGGVWYIRTLTGVSIITGESWGAPGYKPVSSMP